MIDDNMINDEIVIKQEYGGIQLIFTIYDVPVKLIKEFYKIHGDKEKRFPQFYFLMNEWFQSRNIKVSIIRKIKQRYNPISYIIFLLDKILYSFSYSAWKIQGMKVFND